jgi:hypothetical protein
VIAVICKGSSFGHAAAYPFRPGERGEHVDAHVVAGGNVLLGDRRGRDWVADMRFCAGLRPSVSRPVWQCLLRAAPRDRLLGGDPAGPRWPASCSSRRWAWPGPVGRGASNPARPEPDDPSSAPRSG